MSRLEDILSKPIAELSDEELTERINYFKKSRIVTLEQNEDKPATVRKPKKVKSNSDKQLLGLLKGASKEQLADLMKQLEG